MRDRVREHLDITAVPKDALNDGMISVIIDAARDRRDELICDLYDRLVRHEMQGKPDTHENRRAARHEINTRLPGLIAARITVVDIRERKRLDDRNREKEQNRTKSRSR